MYIVKEVKIPRTKRTRFELKEEYVLEGYQMPSRSKKFQVDGISIENLILTNRGLARPIIVKKVETKYNKLLMLLTELLVTDDDSGETYREALNQIERFRQIIKNKYRKFLTQKELEGMANQLKLIQMEITSRLYQGEFTYDYTNATGKSR
ncbi:MAG: hypothetical protein E7160_00495 [Firmicutes bacterium]|nr:hypothetical protein [Bacillota bacterium]